MRQPRGQTLVLGALSFLVLALMVTLSFNLSQALRAKISLQQHSDSLAYSMAVMEARALNYYAVSNRTMAASYVAMNSLHAYMAAASVTGQMMQAGSVNFSKITQREAGMCDENEHCGHAVEAAKIASDYSRAATQYDNKARALESRFSAAVTALDKMIDELHGSQRSVHERTRGAVRDGMSQGLRALADYNAPGVSGLPDGVGGINAQEFDCAVDGMQCPGGPSSLSARSRAQVMAEVANATRTDWPAHRAGLIESGEPQYLHPEFLEKLTQDIPGGSIRHEVRQHSGTAKLVQRRTALREGGTQKGNEGTTVSADERGTLLNEWNDHTGTFSRSYEARIWSDTQSGGHAGSRAHRGSHRFDGTNAKALETCSASGNCFMKFRGNANPQKDWGQPRVYSYVTQSLRIGDPQKAPWELNASAEVSFTHGTQGTTKVTLAPGEGAGLSKALVYYHRFDNADLRGESTPGAEAGGWQEPPNLFAPYWRAKLHPLTSQQAEQVLNAAGNSDAAQIVANSPGLSL